jgi:hypothetical protein
MSGLIKHNTCLFSRSSTITIDHDYSPGYIFLSSAHLVSSCIVSSLSPSQYFRSKELRNRWSGYPEVVSIFSKPFCGALFARAFHHSRIAQHRITTCSEFCETEAQNMGETYSSSRCLRWRIPLEHNAPGCLPSIKTHNTSPNGNSGSTIVRCLSHGRSTLRHGTRRRLPSMSCSQPLRCLPNHA